MMNKMTVKIGDKEYPCRMTMGAMLRFKRETGKEIGEIGDADLSLMAILIWCCTVSACRADNVPFEVGLEDFCDAIDEQEMMRISGEMTSQAQPADQGAGKEKKSL
jgi:hypothetical protein